jgi:hypothetical protein
MLHRHPHLELALSLAITAAGTTVVVALLVVDKFARKIGAQA